jgi:hypothetical protein
MHLTMNMPLRHAAAEGYLAEEARADRAEIVERANGHKPVRVAGGELYDRHQALGEQELAHAVLEGALRDLRYDPDCSRHRLAVAWLNSAHDCGCEDLSAISIDEVCDALRIEPLAIHRFVSKLAGDGSKFERRRLVCRLERQVADLRATLKATRRSRLQWMNVARAKRLELRSAKRRTVRDDGQRWLFGVNP